MGLLDDLKAASEPKPVGAMEQILATLGSEEREALLTYVGMVRAQRSLPQPKRTCTAASLLAILTKNGYDIGKTSVQDYIKGDSQ